MQELLLLGLGASAGVGGFGWFRRWLERRVSPPSTESRVIEPDAYRIDDGVDYRQPLVLPGDVAADQMAAYFESTRQTYRSQPDASRSAAYDGPVLMPTEDPLCEWGYATRKRVLTNCHAAYHRNPLAKRAVDLTRQFAVGKGFTLACQNEQVKAVLDAFMNNPENAVKEYEKTFLQDLQIDGELFIRFFTNDVGDVVMVPLAPWHITEISTDPEFFRRVHEYRLQYTPTQHSVEQIVEPVDVQISADEVLHVAINRHSYELRGRSDLYVTLPWLRAYKDWLEDRVRQNQWRGALLWWVKIARAGIGTIAAKVAQYRKPPTPGSVVVTSDAEEWTPLSNSVNANDASEDGRQVKLMSVVGLGMAEYMLGDGENANLATATAQELPSLWKFMDAQEIMREQVWTPILKRVITEAVNASLLPREVVLQDSAGDPVLDKNGQETLINATEAFSVEYHKLDSDDPKTLAEALALDLMNELVSIETAMQQRGYDPAQERRRMAREKEVEDANIYDRDRRNGNRDKPARPSEVEIAAIGPDDGEEDDAPSAQ